MTRPFDPTGVRHVMQGHLCISTGPGDVLGALLGSCVAAGMRDPALGLGGLNHFLLPGEDPGGTDSLRYGAHAMDQLIAELLRAGAHRDRLEVYLFGGANVLKGLPKIGAANSRFSRAYVQASGLRLCHADLGGSRGRRITFCPATGHHTTQMMMDNG